jgi:serine/threonine-protein phosphatase 6 regulatory ankyrin repeat subunit B
MNPNDPFFTSFFTKYPLLLNRYFGFDPKATLLYTAVGGNEDLLQALLRIPSLNVNKGANQGGKTPLHKACSTGNLVAVRSLLQHPSVDVNRFEHPRFPSELGRFRTGYSPLHLAIKEGDEDILEQLLAHPRIDVNVRDSYGQTPYSYAVERARKRPEVEAYARMAARLRTISGLLTSFPRRPRLGEDNSTDAIYHDIPTTLLVTGKIFDAVLRNVTTDAFRALLDLSSESSVNDICTSRNEFWEDYYRFPKALNTVESVGETALMRACRRGAEEKVALLLEHPFIDITQPGCIFVYNYFSEYTFEMPNTSFPLMCAIRSPSITALLLRTGLLDVNQKNIHRETALMRACEVGVLEVVRTLLASPHIDLNLKDIHSQTALVFAAIVGHTDVIRILLADPRLDRKGIGHAARRAAARGHVLATKLCVGSLVGTEREIRREKGLVLKQAYQSGSLELVRWLLSVGGRISPNDHSQIRDSRGERPFIVSVLLNACMTGHFSIVRHLLQEPFLTQYGFYRVSTIATMEQIDEIDERGDQEFLTECATAGLVMVPTRASPLGQALRKGLVDIVVYLADLCRFPVSPLANVAWMNSMTSKYNGKNPPDLEAWAHYVKHIDVNYIGAGGRTLLMKACVNGSYHPYVKALLTIPTINIAVKDDEGKTAWNLAYGEGKRALKAYIDEQRVKQKQTLLGLAEICLFAKVPLPRDLQICIGQFLIEYRAPVPPVVTNAVENALEDDEGLYEELYEELP